MKSGPKELAAYHAQVLESERKPHQKGQRTMMSTRLEPGETLDPERQAAAAKRLAAMGMLSAASTDKEPLTFPDATAEFNAQQDAAAERHPELAPPAPKERATAVPGKCANCGRYWSSHDLQGNVANCRGAANTGKTFSREAVKAEAPAPASGGVLRLEQANEIYRLEVIKTTARDTLREANRAYETAMENWKGYLDSLTAR